ncbi:serine O-acetyltransferase [Marinimicrobium alkaliphilum]|uniref:serine O-acetyltransferase n=1 Tax=Marinimicrobium alkaliphilum TaxID=2202654 RepID=UPI000DB9FBE9|nr:serine O-acetyltransferase [Marinimicrobium alkaliphilum]
MVDPTLYQDISVAGVWRALRAEAQAAAQVEPVLASFYHASLLNHDNFAAAISFHLANKLDSHAVPAMQIREVFEAAMVREPALAEAMCRDMRAYRDRDPACDRYTLPFLFFKGYHALQAHRFAHHLWDQGRETLALYLQNQISRAFDVDIHPAARIGDGIMIDHATGVVVGETAVIENDVSLLHAVTLGGSGLTSGDRHPKIRHGVLISTGAKILGNIEVGEGAVVGAGSVVLESVPAHSTVVGVPARVVGRPRVDEPALTMDHEFPSTPE